VALQPCLWTWRIYETRQVLVEVQPAPLRPGAERLRGFEHQRGGERGVRPLLLGVPLEGRRQRLGQLEQPLLARLYEGARV
jgi:hypothetical protein